ncbi:unnamed protein product [Rotaria socialis]|uniref:Uncharacterized protein n=2 Tax=Rotaria socialis TaxID=392032 RepID=A0A817U3B6_9BILA|nr:unnamed protein product [Rotaria socialis]CAF3451170.1 unnamed protein product [Rotaria socialis]CAF3472537.1 unnamed protein product [Rotaria socialis]
MMKLYIYIVVLVHIEWTFGIRCYSCTGKKNGEQNLFDPCLNPAENVGDGNVYEIDCLNTKLCWKAVTGGKIRRGCGEKRCAFIPDINMGPLVSQTCCSNDLCNRTSSVMLSKAIVYSISFLIFFFRLLH